MGTSPYFNFASLIALLAALAFSLPFLVRLAEKFGIDRSFSILVTLATAIVALAFVVVRNRLRHKERILARIAQIEAQIEDAPEKAASYSYQSDHLADLYLTLGQKQKAVDAFERYLQIVEDQQVEEKREKERVIIAIERLKKDLAQNL